MKHTAAFVIIVCAVACIPAAAEPGFAFSVKPGMLINAAHFGYSTGSMFAGVGMEFASVSYESKSTYEEPETTYTYSNKVGANVFLPQVAGKLFFGGEETEGEEAGTVKPYVWLSAFYSLASASVKYDGQPDTEATRSLTDILSGNVGGALAFGAEYRFAPSFSLSGEFGARMLFGGAKTESSYGGEYSYVTENNLGLGITYTTLGLNFYF